MTNTYTETILVHVPLPDFLVSFKDTCVNMIVPGLSSIIADLENPRPNNSTLSILSAIFILLLIKSLLSNLFSFKAPQAQLVSQAEVDTEVRLLTTEIRKMKESLKKIIEENPSGKVGTTVAGNASLYEPHDVQKLVEFYQKAANDFQNLATYILGSHETILKQIKSIKKNKTLMERTPSQGSLESNEANKQEEPKKVNTEAEEQESQPVEKKFTPKVFKPPGPPVRKRVIPPPPMAR